MNKSVCHPERSEGSRLYTGFFALLRMTTLLVFLPSQLFAYEAFGPINLRTQHPVMLQTSDLTPRAAQVLPAHTLQVSQSAAYSNLFEVENNANTRIDFDMELLRSNLSILWGAGEGFQLGLEIPFERFDGGFLDGMIADYHDAFSFPTGGRELLPENRFRYQFTRNGTNLINIPQQDFSPSDPVFSLQQQVFGGAEQKSAVSWFADFRFPMSDKADGVTTGDPGVVLGLAAQKSHKRFHGYVNTALVFTGINQAMQPFVHDERFTYALAGEVSLLPTLSVLAQLSGGTPFGKNTGLEFWDEPPLDLVLGFKGKEPKLIAHQHDLLWQFGFSEDLTATGPSVDFTVFASLGIEIH